jgi:hypothetical protein
VGGRESASILERDELCAPIPKLRVSDSTHPQIFSNITLGTYGGHFSAGGVPYLHAGHPVARGTHISQGMIKSMK